MNFSAIKNASKNITEILLYGEIKDGMLSKTDARSLAQQISDIDADKIIVRINSYGGSVFTGMAIYSSLKQHKADIEVRIDGVAASIASVIAMAGDKIIMPANSMMMIHKPLVQDRGNADDKRKMADTLDKIEESILNVYESKTKVDRNKICSMLRAETWLTAQDALKMGFADVVDEAFEVAACLKDGEIFFNNVSEKLEKFESFPKELIQKLEKIDENKPEDAQIKPEKEKKQMEFEQIKALIPAFAEAFKAMTPENLNEVLNENPAILEEFKAKKPEIFAKEGEKTFEDGIKAERERIQAIEALEIAGHDEIVNAAKFENAISAQELAVEILKADKVKSKVRLDNIIKDAEIVNQVPASAETTNAKALEEEKDQKIIKAAAEAINERRK